MLKATLTMASLIAFTTSYAVSAEETSPKKARATKTQAKTQAKAQKKPKAPSLEELKKVVQPLLAKLALTSEQQHKANSVMREETWKDAVAAFARKRNKEIFAAAHKKIPETMPTVMMPRMMAYNMQKNMKGRMAKQAGPPTPKEIQAIRSDTQKRMRAKLAPAIMGGLTDLTEKRMQELLLDKKVLARVLADQISETSLTDRQKRDFDKVLTAAGYPKELTHGPDAVLAKRVIQMLEGLADNVVTELKKADAAEKAKK